MKMFSIGSILLIICKTFVNVVKSKYFNGVQGYKNKLINMPKATTRVRCSMLFVMLLRFFGVIVPV